MGNYNQWRNGFDSHGVRHVTWCCGIQHVLVEEVIDSTREFLKVSEFDNVSFTAGQTRDKDIWAAANQYPMIPGVNRLVFVRDAQRIKNWAPLKVWMDQARYLSSNYLLFVSNAENLGHGQDEEGRKELKPPISWIQGKGHLVVCNTLKPEDAVAWVRRHAPTLDDRVADHLLTRVGGNLAAALNICKKLALFSGQPGKQAVDMLCAEMPSDEFAELLLMLKRKEALLAAERVPTDDLGRILGLLESRLDMLGALRRAVIGGVPLKDVRTISGIDPYQARLYWDIAKNYDLGKVTHRRQVLAMLDDSYHSGAREGILESLVALW